MNPVESGERHPAAATRAIGRVLLTIYGVILTLIALWPSPVDQNAGPFLRAVGRVIPPLTVARIEFSANILLFVPLGLLLMLILRRRYLVLPIAIVVTVAIESAQGLLLDRRTPSMLDIIANTAGACLGMLIVAGVEWWQARASRSVPSAEERAAQDAETWAALGITPAPPAPPVPPATPGPRSPGPPPPLPPDVAASRSVPRSSGA